MENFKSPIDKEYLEKQFQLYDIRVRNYFNVDSKIKEAVESGNIDNIMYTKETDDGPTIISKMGDDNLIIKLSKMNELSDMI